MTDSKGFRKVIKNTVKAGIEEGINDKVRMIYVRVVGENNDMADVAVAYGLHGLDMCLISIMNNSIYSIEAGTLNYYQMKRINEYLKEAKERGEL
jgi:hypothetical protein